MTDVLWTLADFVAGTGGRLTGGGAGEISGVSIDSRTVQPGEAYFAILGDVHDGHAFAGAALDKGAAVAVVAEAKLAEMPAGGRYVVVDDVLAALRRLGVAARARTGARVIAVTGSAGKTSTKEALRLVLGQQGRVHASAASFNNHWGVPLTLARMPADTDFAVFEIGMNHAGEIADLVPMVAPHVAVVTTVAPVHLEYFGTVAKIAEAKAEIFSGLAGDASKQRLRATAVINGDLAETPILVAAAQAVDAEIVTFGEAAGLTSRLVSCTLHPDGSDVIAVILGTPVAYRVGAAGRHLVMNSLAVLSAVVAAGADLATAAAGLAGLAQPKGRGSLVHLAVAGAEALLIDESYNANPASMRAALDLLGQVGAGRRRVAVLGDMLELGPDGADMHAGLIDGLVAAGVDTVYLAGPLMEHLWRALPTRLRGGYARTSSLLEPVVIAGLAPGDAIMVKGSNGIRMGRLVETLSSHFA